MIVRNSEFYNWLQAISESVEEDDAKLIYRNGVARWPQWRTVRILKVVEEGGLHGLDALDLERRTRPLINGCRVIGLFPPNVSIVYLTSDPLLLNGIGKGLELFTFDRSILLDSNIVPALLGYCHAWMPRKFPKIPGVTLKDRAIHAEIESWICEDLDFNPCFFAMEYLEKCRKSTSRATLRRILRAIAHLQACDRARFKANGVFIPDRRYLHAGGHQNWNDYLRARSTIPDGLSRTAIMALARECLLWETVILSRARLSDPERRAKLMHYMLSVCGGVWLRELVISHLSLFSPSGQRPPWFEQVASGMSGENLNRHISSVAWDISLVRLAEEIYSTPGYTDKRLLFPYFCTNDRRLGGYADDFRLKMLVSYPGGSIPFLESKFTSIINDFREYRELLSRPRPQVRVQPDEVSLRAELDYLRRNYRSG